MNREYLQGVFNYLNEQYKEYYFAKNSQKGIIENRVRMYANNFNNELYLMLNKGGASGLFRHGFFESDLSSALKTIERMLDNE